MAIYLPRFDLTTRLTAAQEGKKNEKKLKKGRT
jgi:hypothetical protein